MLNHVRDRLGIEPHETTDDGKFTLLALECLGSCDTAPVALFNEKLHENLTIEKVGIERLISGFAHQRPWSYGVVSVLIALAAGWAASAAFRRV